MSKHAVVVSNQVTTLHLAAQGERIFVVRSKLFKSPGNVRKAPRSQASLEELAALIKAQGGVIQNLVAYAERKKGKLTGRYAVVAGGGRLDAVDLLIARAEFSSEYAFPVLLVPDYLAIEVSTAENSGREALHPADEFVAFKAMFDEGKNHEEIAARFGVTPLVVARRLKLANVSPLFLEMYRENKITLEHLMALALTDDHDMQLAVWESLPNHGRYPHLIRNFLTKGEENISSSRFGRFVGVEAYAAVGGTIRRDLFSDSGDGYIADMPLLHRLVQEKLDAEAESVRASGEWAWVEVVPDMSDFDHRRYTVAVQVKREASEEEAAALDVAEAERDRLSSIVDDMDGDEEDYATLYEQYEAADAHLTALHSVLYSIDPQTKGRAGVVLGVDYDGSLKIRSGLLLAGAKASEAGDAVNSSAQATPKRPAHSEKLVRRLTAQRTAVLQAGLLERPDIALIALVAQLSSDFVYKRQGAVQIRANVESLSMHAGDAIKEFAAYQKVAELARAWEARLQEVDDIFAWLLEQPQQTVWELLAFCVARSLNTVQHQDDEPHHGFLSLARALDLKMADWWRPTAENYLAHVSKAKVIDTVVEALGAEASVNLLDLKRDALVAQAAEKLAGSTWVPPAFRVE